MIKYTTAMKSRTQIRTQTLNNIFFSSKRVKEFFSTQYKENAKNQAL